ncbi:MAG: CHAT domain-containing protein, partial [Chloroflexi bacterium]|nr:CHAT domain-containing protein [Chloroflexota bacterium]
ADLRRRLTGQGWTLRDGVTSWQTIQRCLPGHHVLHVLAHGQFKPGELPGNGTAYLLLEHEGTERIARGAVDRVSDDEIIAGLAGVHPLPQLIFLAACDSARRPPAAAAATGANPFVGLAPKLVSRGVPAIVAMQDLVPMNLARTLTTDFYRNQFAWAIPVLFLRLKHGQLFSKPVAPRQPFEPEMVLIPAGEFKMGSDPGPGIPKHETPQHTVTLSAYYIGKYPVTNAQYAEFIKTLKLSDLGEAHARKPEGWLNLEPPADRLAHPVTGVSWRDAVAYCRWLGEQTDRHYRLPTEAEWEKAARGAAGRRYPWGDAWDPACANVGKDTTAVTDHPSGASPYGCQDLLGNVLQWTSTVWGTQPQQPDYPYPYRSDDGREVANPRALPAQARLVCRGGPYPFRGEALRCTARSNMTPDSTSSRTAWRGFRVAMDIR